MKRRLFPLIVCWIMLLSIITGCAQPTAVSSPEAPAAETEAPAVEETQAPAPAATEAPAAVETQAPSDQEKTPLVVWMAGDDARFMMESTLPAKFEAENPQYDLEVVQLPWDALHDKLVAGFTGGELPAVSQGADHWVGEFAILGGLDPLDDFKTNMGYDDEEFLPRAWEHFRFSDGKIYAAPFIWESRLLFYRTDLLQEAGLENPPQSLDELVEVGKTLSNGEDRFGIAHQDSWLDFHFFSWILYAYGGDYVNADFNACTLTDEPAIQALNYYKQLYDENIIPKAPEKRVETFQGFKEGYYAMAESGAWWFGLIRTQAPELEGKWAVGLLPEGQTTITYGHPNPWLVPVNSPNKEGAYAWMSFMLDPENAAEWARFYGQTPAIKAAFELPGVKDSPEQQAMLESALRGVNSLHNVPAAETISEMVWNMLAEVRDGLKTPEQAAQDTCASINDILAQR